MPRQQPPFTGQSLQYGDEARRFFSYDDVEDLVMAHRRDVMEDG